MSECGIGWQNLISALQSVTINAYESFGGRGGFTLSLGIENLWHYSFFSAVLTVTKKFE